MDGEETTASVGGESKGGWRMKSKNWFSSKAPSVKEGLKKITEKAPTVKEGLKKMTTKVEGIRMNTPMKEGLKRITTTTAPVKEGFKKMTTKEGLMKGKVTFERGLTSVSSFTQGETKLLMSKAKRKIYCKNQEIEDPEFAASIDSVLAWKAMLESQRSNLRRMIKDQKVFEDSQIQLTLALQKVPADCDYSAKSVLFGGEIESRVEKLVPTSCLEDLAKKIEDILSMEFAELHVLKRKYTTAKNEVDVSTARLDQKEDSERLQSEVAQAKQHYMQCRADITELTTKIIEKKSMFFNPILLQVSEDVSSAQASVQGEIR